jgi:uroporphyrinogen-III decarboxylase
LHICGDISTLLEYVPQTGADIIDIDWMVNFERAVNIFKGRCSANGNFDPVEIVLRGNTDQVKNAVEECVAVGDNTTLIAAGCEIPKFTPLENMYEIKRILRNQ